MQSPFRTSYVMCRTQYRMKTQHHLLKIEEFQGDHSRALNQMQNLVRIRAQDTQTLTDPRGKREFPGWWWSVIPGQWLHSTSRPPPVHPGGRKCNVSPKVSSRKRMTYRDYPRCFNISRRCFQFLGKVCERFMMDPIKTTFQTNQLLACVNILWQTCCTSKGTEFWNYEDKQARNWPSGRYTVLGDTDMNQIQWDQLGTMCDFSRNWRWMEAFSPNTQ